MFDDDVRRWFESFDEVREPASDGPEANAWVAVWEETAQPQPSSTAHDPADAWDIPYYGC